VYSLLRIHEVIEDVFHERLEYRLLAASEPPVSVDLSASVNSAGPGLAIRVAAAAHQEVAAFTAEERVVARSSLGHVVAACADDLRALRTDAVDLLRADDVALGSRLRMHRST